MFFFFTLMHFLEYLVPLVFGDGVRVGVESKQQEKKRDVKKKRESIIKLIYGTLKIKMIHKKDIKYSFIEQLLMDQFVCS